MNDQHINVLSKFYRFLELNSCSGRVDSARWWVGGGEGVVLKEEKGKGLDSPRLRRE